MATQTFNDSRIDRSMGMLLMLLLIGGFFLLAILGMQSVQEQARDMATVPPPPAPTEQQPVYDFISDAGSK